MLGPRVESRFMLKSLGKSWCYSLKEKKEEKNHKRIGHLLSFYYVSDSILGPFQRLTDLVFKKLSDSYCFPHFTGEETKAHERMGTLTKVTQLVKQRSQD